MQMKLVMAARPGLECWRCCIGIGIIVFTVGCGRHNRVTGTVRLDGRPLPTGQVTFLCDGQGRPVISGDITEDGSYEIVDPPVGRARVVVETFKPQPKPEPSVDPVTGETVPIEWEDTGPYVPIPKRYALPKTSRLELEIKPGEQRFDIELTK